MASYMNWRRKLEFLILAFLLLFAFSAMGAFAEGTQSENRFSLCFFSVVFLTLPPFPFPLPRSRRGGVDRLGA